jgi:hypothetical protein
MNQLTNIKLLAALCFLLSVAALSSCKKDNEERTDQIQLLSFGPTGAKHGDTLRFFGTNLDKVTEVVFTGTNAAVKQSEFKQQTWEEILLIVPQAAEKGSVTLKTPQGDLVSKTAFNLSVESRVTQMPAPARPGENITLTGEYMNWVKSITFNKDLVVTTFSNQTLTQLTVTVPENAQTGRLVISYGGTDSMDVETDTLWVKLPTVTGMAPNPVKHATNLTITGTDLDLARKVIFPGVATPVTTFVSQSATQLVVAVPGGTSKGKLKLEAASGVQTTTAMDLDVVLPAVTSFSPTLVARGANLTITGTNLDIVSGVSFVGVNDAVTSFVSKTATQLVLKVPDGALTGKITLRVQNSTLTVTSAADLNVIGSSVPPIIIYEDGLTSAWNGWTGGGWGGTKDADNTTPVRSGSKSVKISYTDGGYGVPWQLGGANISLAGYTSLKVSLYGGAGSNGKTVNIGFNEKDGKTVTLVEGQWTDFDIPLSQISTTDKLTHLYIKNYSASGAFTIFVDNMGIY